MSVTNQFDQWKKLFEWNPFPPKEDITKQKCLFDEYIKRNPDKAGEPLWLSCPCPKCTPRC